MKGDPATIFHTGDVHLSNTLPYARASRSGGRTDRLQDQVDMLKRMLDDAREAGADGVVLAGDVVDESVLDGPTLDALVEVILHARVPLAIGPGNHEASSPRGGSFVSQFLGRLAHTVELLEWIGQDERGSPKRVLEKAVPAWLRMWWVDYCPPDEAARRVSAIPLRERASVYPAEARPFCASILWLHHAVKGCTDGGWTCDDGLDADAQCQKWTHVISGHYHEPQSFGVVRGKANGFYMGATMEHDFGDAKKEAERGWWRMDVEQSAYSDGLWPYEGGRGLHFTHAVHESMPRFHVVKQAIEAPGLVHFLAPAQARAGDYVRFVAEATHAEWALCEGHVRRFADAVRETHKLRFVDVQPKFIRPAMAEARLGGGVETADRSELVERYVDAVVDRVGTGLDRDRLVEVGRALIEEEA